MYRRMNLPNPIPTLAILLLTLTACSELKNRLPDKHKDYVNSIEIAPLTIPSDLSTPNFANDNINTAPKLASMPVQVRSGADKVDSKTPPKVSSKKSKKLAPPAPVRPVVDTDNRHNITDGKVRLMHYVGGSARLQIDEPFILVWRIVGKALSRKSLEIVDRNINNGLFLLQYDPNEIDIEYGSIWGELMFLFGKDKSNEQEYQIRLLEHEGTTEVLVLDDKGIPLSGAIGLNLLNLIGDTIRASFAEQR